MYFKILAERLFHHPEYLTLAGQASKKLFQEIKNAKTLEKYKKLVDFFMVLLIFLY